MPLTDPELGIFQDGLKRITKLTELLQEPEDPPSYPSDFTNRLEELEVIKKVLGDGLNGYEVISGENTGMVYTCKTDVFGFVVNETPINLDGSKGIEKKLYILGSGEGCKVLVSREPINNKVHYKSVS